jgi:hypothetical protein
MDQVRKIAIFGAGNVGAALGRIWSRHGHTITFGLPDPDSAKNQEKLKSIPGARAATNAEAASGADIVALCVPWEAAQSAIETAGDLSGKIVIDCMNPVSPDLSGLTIGHSTSAGEQVAAWAPKAHVVKAFNTIGAPRMGDADFGGIRADGFYCGDNAGAKAAVSILIGQAGLEPVDVGPLKNARMLEPLALLWIDLAVIQGQGPNHGFKLLRR